jgi:gamma-glutamyltranspeptidase/glutathione hydrolase
MGGILTEQDMAEFAVDLTDPLELAYRGSTVYACTGASGAPTALEVMAAMQFLNTVPYEADDPAYWGDMAGALQLAWHDRLALLGDIPGMNKLVDHLMSHRYAESLAARVRAGNFATAPCDFDPTTCTVHVNTCDADRNMVSMTQTHGGGYGSRVVVPGLGIALGHGMSRFNPETGHPNSVGPWKQPLHNMSPLVLTRHGKPLAAIGLPGGRTIPSLMPQFVADLIDFGLTPAQALNRPRIHTQGYQIQYTSDLPEYARKSISQRGHSMVEANAIGGIASFLLVRGDEVLGSSQGGAEAALGM